MKLTPKNWNNFQHYKHRNPPWIKLHKNLLDDMQFQRLPLASKALAPMLWLLASENQIGLIDKTTDELAFRLRITEKELVGAIKPLIDNGFFVDADNVLASCLQDATTETEKRRVEKSDISTPEGVSENIFKDYLAIRKVKKSPLTITALDGLKREAKKANLSLEDVLRLCCEKSWVGFKAEWVSKQTVSNQGHTDDYQKLLRNSV